MTRLHLTVIDETAEQARWIRAASDHHPNTAAVTARPSTQRRRIRWLAEDLLAEVGIRDDVSRRARNSYEDWTRVLIWYLAHRIRTR